MPRLEFHTASARAVLALLLIALVLTQGACSLQVQLVAEYDELTDRSVADLQSATNAFVEGMLEHAPLDAQFYGQHRGFFEEASGRITTLIVRAQALEEGLSATPLTENLQNLKDLMDQFERGVRPTEDGTVVLRSPLAIESSRTALNQGFRAIVTHMIFLKKASDSRRR